MRFTPAANGNLVNHFPVGFRCGVRIYGYELVRSIAHARHAERPHVHEILLALDEARHVRRIASLVSIRPNRDDIGDCNHAKAQDQSEKDAHSYLPGSLIKLLAVLTQIATMRREKQARNVRSSRAVRRSDATQQSPPAI